MTQEQRLTSETLPAPTKKLVDIVTDSAKQAGRRRDRIKGLLTSMTEQTNKVGTMLEEAQTNEDHLTLGYKSWTTYLVGEYAGALADLNRAARREVVGSLTAAGMSTRAIADVVDVDHSTVVRDQQVVQHAPPVVSEGDDLTLMFECGSRHCWHSPICQRVKATPQRTSEPVAPGSHRFTETKKITGRDGKAYPIPTRPVVERRPMRQTSLPKQYFNAIWELDKAIQRLEKLHRSDRFVANQKSLDDLHSPRLSNLKDHLTTIVMDLGGIYACHICGASIVSTNRDFDKIPSTCKVCAEVTR